MIQKSSHALAYTQAKRIPNKTKHKQQKRVVCNALSDTCCSCRSVVWHCSKGCSIADRTRCASNVHCYYLDSRKVGALWERSISAAVLGSRADRSILRMSSLSILDLNAAWSVKIHSWKPSQEQTRNREAVASKPPTATSRAVAQAN